MNITRKNFLKKIFSSFIGFYFIDLLKPFQRIIAQNNFFNKTVIHIQGKDISKSTINKMVSEGFKQLGGIGKLIKPGMQVVLKPNIGFSSSPERAHTTNPDLVEAVARLCIKAGARVKIFDRPAYSTRLSYRRSGILAAGKRAGADVIFMNERKFKNIRVKNGINLRSIKVYKDIFKADFVINMPIAKHHYATELTLGMKNLMGLLGGQRGNYHINLHKNIVDFAKTIPVNLVIMDAARILTANGPGAGTAKDIKIKKSLLFSTNQLTIDAYTARKFFRKNPASIGYLKFAYKERMGEINISRMKVIKKYV